MISSGFQLLINPNHFKKITEIQNSNSVFSSTRRILLVFYTYEFPKTD